MLGSLRLWSGGSNGTAMMCAVRRRLISIVLLAGLLTPSSHPSECWTDRPPEKKLLWVAPDSTWRMLGFRQYEKDYLRELVARRPAGIVGGLMYEKIVEEEGDWYVIRVNFINARQVTFTQNTKIIVTQRGGRKVASEAICCWPDRPQTAVYDTRVAPVVVTEQSVWCGDNKWGPFGAVKFPPGSIQLGEIESFEVVGAVAEAGGRKDHERR